jgi:hypothetical protein
LEFKNKDLDEAAVWLADSDLDNRQLMLEYKSKNKRLKSYINKLKKKFNYNSVSVKPFTHDGVKYYKSSDNILYDKNGNPQGKWDETTKTVTPISAEDQEAEEEEDDEDDNSEEEEEEYEEEEELGSARYTSANSEILDEIEYYECLGSD